MLAYKGEAKVAIANRERKLSALAERTAHDSDATVLTIFKGGGTTCAARLRMGDGPSCMSASGLLPN